jgi:hypothetical protein
LFQLLNLQSFCFNIYRDSGLCFGGRKNALATGGAEAAAGAAAVDELVPFLPTKLCQLDTRPWRLSFFE